MAAGISAQPAAEQVEARDKIIRRVQSWSDLPTPDPEWSAQLTDAEADSNWSPIAELRRPRSRAIVYVVDCVVTRIRGIDPNGKWN